MQLTRCLRLAAACLVLAASAAQAQSTKLLPNDTEMILTFNLQQLLKSDIVKSNKDLYETAKGKINDQLEAKDLGKWLKKADFDIYKDLHSITFAFPGDRVWSKGLSSWTGTSTSRRSKPPRPRRGTASRRSRSPACAAFEVSPKGDKTMYVGVLNKKTMIACATKADFEEAVARAGGEKSAKFTSAVFKSLLETVESKQSISFAATSAMVLKLADKAPKGAAQVKQAVDVLKKMDGFSAAVTVQKSVDFQLGVNAKDADTAAQYAGLGNILLGAAKAKVEEAAKKDERLKPAVEIVNTVRVTSQGPNLMVRGQITADTLTKLIEMIPKQ